MEAIRLHETPVPGTTLLDVSYLDLTAGLRLSSSLKISSLCFIMILFWSVRILNALAIRERDGLSHLNSFSLAGKACLPLIMDPRRFSSLSSSAKAARFFRAILSDMLAAACSRLTSAQQSSQNLSPLSS